MIRNYKSHKIFDYQIGFTRKVTDRYPCTCDPERRNFHKRLVNDLIQLKKTITDEYIEKLKERYTSLNEERSYSYKIPVKEISKKSIKNIPFILKKPVFKNDFLLVDYESISLGMIINFRHEYVFNNLYDYLFTSRTWVLLCEDQIKNVDSSKDVFIDSIKILNRKDGKSLHNGLFCDHYKNRFDVIETCTNHTFETMMDSCSCWINKLRYPNMKSGMIPCVIPCEYCNK